MIDSGFMIFCNFRIVMGIVFFCKSSFIGEVFWHFRIYVYDFQKIFWIDGILLRHFSGFMGILLSNSPDLLVVLLRFEWHNPVLWKLK